MKCPACGDGELKEFADLGNIPVLCGVHYATDTEALESPLGRMTLGYCGQCAYVRNVAFDPDVLVYDATMDTNLHHSPAFQSFSADLVHSLTTRFDLSSKTILDIGCGQGEFLRELCHEAGARGFGYDAMYAGVEGSDPSGAHFTARYAPLGDPTLPSFDFVTSRHWFEHVNDPYDFLVALRDRAGDRAVGGYFEVPDAGYDLATAGWEVIYPHVSYFEGVSLHRIFERAGWRISGGGTMFHGMFRYVEVVTDTATGVTTAGSPAATATFAAARDRQLDAIGGFAERQRAEVDRWRRTIDDLAARNRRPVLWGAGSRGVQFLTFADPQRRLAAVVDVNPRKWGRYLPMTAHQVASAEVLRDINPAAVIITNPAYRDEIAKSLVDLGVIAEVLVA